MLPLFIALAINAPGAFALDENTSAQAEAAYCSPASFAIMNQQLKNEAVALPLANEQESKNSASGRDLASEPGPYGHSVLGFRYLSRLFGYQGAFGENDRENVENWIASQEANNYQNKKGLWASWNRWVVNSKKRLSVPSGAVNKIEAKAGAEIFFANPNEQGNFRHCLESELSMISCKNYLRDREPEPGDRVYLANPGSKSSIACKLVRNPYGAEARRKAIEAEKLRNMGKPMPSGLSPVGSAL